MSPERTRPAEIRPPEGDHGGAGRGSGMNDGKGKRTVDLAAEETLADHAGLPRGRPAATGPGLDRPTQGRIGDSLRAMYDDLVNQPVPDRFAELLKRLDGGDEPKD